MALEVRGKSLVPEKMVNERSADIERLPVEPSEHPVLFFDGVCGLCDATIRWLIDHDPKRVLRFAPLQGETAARVLPSADSKDLRSVVLVDGAGVHRRSKAVVRTLQHLGGRYRILARLLWCVPGPLRELGYKFISKIRYAIFGKKDLCRLPKPGENERFLA